MLQLGAVTGTVAALAGPTALARAASGTPAHLRRATYVPVAGQRFRVGGTLLKLGAVEDVAGAAADKRLRGHDEAFALTFHGPPGAVAPKTQTVWHPAIGTCSLLVTPVGDAEGGVQRYEIVVDRSVGRPKDPPAPPKTAAAPPERPGSEEAAAEARAEFRAELAAEAKQLQRRIARRRRIKRRKLKRRRAARNRTIAAKRRAALRQREKRGGYVAARRGPARVIG